MKKNVSFILIFSFLALSTLFSQNVSNPDIKAKPEYTKFLIRPKFPVNLAFSFKKSISTKVTQFLSDSSTRSYNRNLDLYFTYYSPGKPENGITELRVTVDSLVWKYKVGGDSVYYDTQRDDLLPPLKYEDYETSSIILGKSYNFYYSPYWDFGKIDGNRLIEQRNMVNDPSEGIADSMRNYFWNYRLSDNYLVNLTDVLKNLVPNNAIDTSMKRNVIFKYDTEELTFVDTTATVQLIKTNSQVNKLKATLNNLKCERNYARIFGFGVFVDIIQSTGKGEYELDISPQGRVDGANGKFRFEILFRDRNETVREVIEEEVNYQLLSNYKV
jgi:hypothetical protein